MLWTTVELCLFSALGAACTGLNGEEALGPPHSFLCVFKFVTNYSLKVKSGHDIKLRFKMIRVTRRNNFSLMPEQYRTVMVFKMVLHWFGLNSSAASWLTECLSCLYGKNDSVYQNSHNEFKATIKSHGCKLWSAKQWPWNILNKMTLLWAGLKKLWDTMCKSDNSCQEGNYPQT